MRLFENPDPLDIFVSLVIGLSSGALVTSIIFMTVIKKKWEARWDYFNRIKVLSKRSNSLVHFSNKAPSYPSG